PRSTVIVCFETLPLPDAVKIGFHKHRLFPYTKPPTRCYTCLHYGHVAKHCRAKVTCFWCGSQGHVVKECKSIGVPSAKVHTLAVTPTAPAAPKESYLP